VSHSGEFDGLIHITRHRPNDQIAYIGFIARPNSDRQTKQTLVTDSLLYAFEVLNLRKLSIEVLSSDTPNIQLLENLGFQQEGILRSQHPDGKEFVDVVLMGIIGSEWDAHLYRVQVGNATPTDLEHTNLPASYRITILTDANSWLTPYTTKLMNMLTSAGHMCEVKNATTLASGGDFCFCLSFSQIVSAEFRMQYRHTLLVHESALPRGRGWAPMTWQILEGASRIPVTLLEAEDEVDSGAIYLQEYIELTGSELNAEWRLLQADVTIRLCMKWIEQYPQVAMLGRAQKGEPSFYPRRKPIHSQLATDKTIAENFELLRVVDNERYPAYFRFRGHSYTLKISRVEE